MIGGQGKLFGRAVISFIVFLPQPSAAWWLQRVALILVKIAELLPNEPQTRAVTMNTLIRTTVLLDQNALVLFTGSTGAPLVRRVLIDALIGGLFLGAGRKTFARSGVYRSWYSQRHLCSRPIYGTSQATPR